EEVAMPRKKSETTENVEEPQQSPLTVSAYDATGIRTGETDLPEAVFGQAPHMAAMHQAFVRRANNARQGTAATKTRSLVRGVGIGAHQTVLVVLPAANDVVARSTNNLPWAKVVLAQNLSLYDIFTHDRLVIAKDAIGLLEETLAS